MVSTVMPWGRAVGRLYVMVSVVHAVVYGVVYLVDGRGDGDATMRTPDGMRVLNAAPPGQDDDAYRD
jgi:hypothetical protein